MNWLLPVILALGVILLAFAGSWLALKRSQAKDDQARRGHWSESRTTSRKSDLRARVARMTDPEAREARKEMALTGPKHRAG